MTVIPSVFGPFYEKVKIHQILCCNWSFRWPVLEIFSPHMSQAILTNCDLLCQESSLLVCIAVVLVWIFSGCLWNVGLCFQNPPRYDNHFSHFLKLYTNLSHLYPGRTAPLFVEGLKNSLCSRSVNCSSKWKPVPTNSLFISPACFF